LKFIFGESTSAMVTTRCHTDDPEDPESKRSKTNENSATIRVSRACRICVADAPRFVAVFDPCGHAVCRSCALKLRWDAYEAKSALMCAYCRGEGRFVLLLDEVLLIERNRCDEDRWVGIEDSALLERLRGVADADADDMLFAELEQADAARPVARAAMRAAGEAAEAANAAADAASEAHSASTQVLAAYYKRQILIDQRGATRSALSAEDVVELDRFTALIAGRSIEQIEADVAEKHNTWKLAQNETNEAIKAAEIAVDALQEGMDSCKAKEARIEQFIVEYKEENEDCAARGLRFSRACRACNDEEPRLRSFFPACGHAVCRECADKAHADVSCPTCHKAGSSIHLFEELLES
ncbi:hypothetical protein PRIPAC_84211, partial [Pristionchus pacificus]